jgi:hypothetical protein
MSESEFGEILEDVHGGDIIRAEDGTIIFLSMAFNPLTSLQLNEVINKMAKWEETAERANTCAYVKPKTMLEAFLEREGNQVDFNGNYY